MFPIVDIAGNVRGFGGRILPSVSDDKEGGAEPKYLNSPETPLYHKGRLLYGLNVAREAIRGEGFVALVEGYMDVIGLFDAGIRNVVASLGTALTPQQCRLIKRYTEHPVVFFDSDGAGTTASLRSFEVFSNEGLSPRALRIEEDKDPDDYVRRVGADEARKSLASASPYPEFLIKETIKRHNPTSIDGKLKVMKEVLPHLAKLETQVEIDHYTEMLAESLSIDATAVFHELYKLRRGGKVKGEITGPSSLEFWGDECGLLRLVLLDGDMLHQASEVVDLELITSSFLRDALNFCFFSHREGRTPDLSALLDHVDSDEKRELLTKLAFCKVSEVDKRKFSTLLDRLRRRSTANQARDVHKRCLAAISSDGAQDKDSLELWTEFMRLKKTAVLK